MTTVVKNVTKVSHFLQGIKYTKLETVINLIWSQPKNHGKDFSDTVSYLDQMATEKGNTVQCDHISEAKPKVVPFMGKIECKSYQGSLESNIQRIADAG